MGQLEGKDGWHYCSIVGDADGIMKYQELIIDMTRLFGLKDGINIWGI